MILISGSQALRHGLRAGGHYDLLQDFREPQDLDIICTWETLQELSKNPVVSIFPLSGNHFVGSMGELKLEVTVAWPGSTDEHLMQAHEGKSRWPLTLYGSNKDTWVDLDWQLAMKLSHRFKRSAHFAKTRQDIFLLRSLGAKIPDMDWFKRRCRETYHGNPNLRQKKDTFFDTPGVTYTYDHDTIHQAMAVYDAPMYLRYKDDEAEVWCSREKWDLLSYEEQLIGVMEEALVLALERSQVPFNFEPDPEWSFDKALEAVCTTVTSGWFRVFAWENMEYVKATWERLAKDYVEKFHAAVEAGIVKEL